MTFQVVGSLLLGSSALVSSCFTEGCWSLAQCLRNRILDKGRTVDPLEALEIDVQKALIGKRISEQEAFVQWAGSR